MSFLCQPMMISIEPNPAIETTFENLFFLYIHLGEFDSKKLYSESVDNVVFLWFKSSGFYQKISILKTSKIVLLLRLLLLRFCLIIISEFRIKSWFQHENLFSYKKSKIMSFCGQNLESMIRDNLKRSTLSKWILKVVVKRT